MLRFRARLGIVACIILGSIAPGSTFDHSGMYSFPATPNNGPAYLLPRLMQIYQFKLNGNPCIGAESGILKIDKNGNARILTSNLNAPSTTSLKTLDKNLAAKLFGPVEGPQGEDDNKAYYWTFHVIGVEPFEQNIYHIDVQFSDPEQHWKEYRVRGYRTNSQWISVE